MIEHQGEGRGVEIRAKIRHDDDGMYWAEVEQLPGCFASGESVPELLEALTEAVSLYRAASNEEPSPVPEFVSISMLVPT